MIHRSETSGDRNLPLGHWESIFSLRDDTVVDGLYLVGPISLPSKSLNFSSIKSWPAIDQLTSHNHLKFS